MNAKSNDEIKRYVIDITSDLINFVHDNDAESFKDVYPSIKEDLDRIKSNVKKWNIPNDVMFEIGKLEGAVDTMKSKIEASENHGK